MNIIRTTISFLVIPALLATGCSQKTNKIDPLTKGLALMRDGTFEEARDSLISATATHTNSLTAFCNLGLTYWKLGDNAAATVALTRAVELSQGDLRPVEFLAYLLIENDNPTGAHQMLTDIEAPTAATLSLMALAAYKAGSSDLARSHLGRALEIDNNYPPALYNLALLCRDDYNMPREALVHYKRFQSAAPNDRRAAETPQAFIGMGPPPEEPPDQEVVEEVTSPEPPSEPAPEPAEQPEPEPVEPTASSPTPAPEISVDSLIKKAEQERNKGNIDTALLTLKSAVESHPDNPDAVWELAQIYDKNLSLKDRSTELYRKFCVMFPNDPRTSEIKQLLQTPENDNTPTPEEEEAPISNGEAFFRLGLEHYANDSWVEAIDSFKKALEENPESSRSAYNLGLAFKANGDLEKASDAFTLALQLEKDMPKALYMLGLTEMQRGDNEAAMANLNRMLRVQPDFAKCHYLLGRLYSDVGRPDMAVLHFERFLRLEPEGSSADYARHWLVQSRDNDGD